MASAPKGKADIRLRRFFIIDYCVTKVKRFMRVLCDAKKPLTIVRRGDIIQEAILRREVRNGNAEKTDKY